MKLASVQTNDCRPDRYTVESVLEGHPDKVCDQICDAILDAYLEVDDLSTVAVECLGTGKHLFIGGEIHSRGLVDVIDIARQVYSDIGYVDDLQVTNQMQVQSSQLRQAIVHGAAGDQGVMYGYACDSAHNYLPFGTYIVNAIARQVDLLRKQTNSYLPDGKVQLTIQNDSIECLTLSVQHPSDMEIEQLRALVLEGAVAKVVDARGISKLYFNHNSSFHNGGFTNDTGLSGRKMACDTYCGLVPHGGGSFSGKDPSKVDRSAAYMARFVAKNVVANQFASSCLVSVAYVFGLEHPVMLEIRTDRRDEDPTLVSVIRDHFDFRPQAIVERLGLRKAQYRQTATYGHFFDPNYSWEQLVSL